MFIPSRRNFGLSATPSRFDRNEDIIFFHVGEVFSNEDAGDTVPANVTVLIVDSELKSSKTDNFICCFGKGFEKSRYLNMLKNSKIFMKTTEMVLNKVDSEGYKIVFVSERIEKFLKLFYDKILHDDKSMFIAGSGNEVLKKRITFTTPGKMRDGVDIPEKNCLIMTSPIGNISQMCGRVVRGSPGKSSAIIIDIVDISYSNEIANSYMNRKIYYNKKEWRIQYVYVSPSGKPIPINELKALNLILNGIHAEDSLSES
jgi:superfamily II DNA or RNA helicase